MVLPYMFFYDCGFASRDFLPVLGFADRGFYGSLFSTLVFFSVHTCFFHSCEHAFVRVYYACGCMCVCMMYTIDVCVCVCYN